VPPRKLPPGASAKKGGAQRSGWLLRFLLVFLTLAPVAGLLLVLLSTGSSRAIGVGLLIFALVFFAVPVGPIRSVLDHRLARDEGRKPRGERPNSNL
jgi:hypothetical protein